MNILPAVSSGWTSRNPTVEIVVTVWYTASSTPYPSTVYPIVPAAITPSTRPSASWIRRTLLTRQFSRGSLRVAAQVPLAKNIAEPLLSRQARHGRQR